MGFSVVSLSLGNPALPFGHRLPRYVQPVGELLLRQPALPAQLLEVGGKVHEKTPPFAAFIVAQPAGAGHHPQLSKAQPDVARGPRVSKLAQKGENGRFLAQPVCKNGHILVYYTQ